MTLLLSSDLIAQLESRCKRRGDRAALCREIGVPAAYLTDVLKGRREPGLLIGQYLGYRRVVGWEKVGE